MKDKVLGIDRMEIWEISKGIHEDRKKSRK